MLTVEWVPVENIEKEAQTCWSYLQVEGKNTQTHKNKTFTYEDLKITLIAFNQNVRLLMVVAIVVFVVLLLIRILLEGDTLCNLLAK